MFKELANIGSMLKQAQQLGGQMNEMAEQMKRQRVVGSAGGGMVEIEANGVLEILQCRIDPKVFEQGDRELIEDLIVTAVNQAVAKSKQLHVDAMQNLTGGIQLPDGVQQMLEKLTGGNEEK